MRFQKASIDFKCDGRAVPGCARCQEHENEENSEGKQFGPMEQDGLDDV